MKEKIKSLLKIALLFALGLPVSCDEDNDVELPILTTLDANNIKCSTAYSGGLISEDGGGEISSRGVCWNTSPNPTIEDSEKSEDGAEIGSFNSLLPNLTSGTTYYVRAYATNEAGTAYGNEISFTTICEQPTSADFVLGHIDDYNDLVLLESGFVDRCDGWPFEVQVSHSLNLPDGLFLEMTISDVIANVSFNGALVRKGDSFVIPNDDRRIRVNFGSVYDYSNGYPECILRAECGFTLRIKGEVQDKSLQKYDCHYYNGGGVTNTTYFWTIYSTFNEDECCFDNSQ